jgi:hypothetical protein
VFAFRDRYQHNRNRDPEAAKANHAQPFGSVPAVCANDDAVDIRMQGKKCGRLNTTPRVFRFAEAIISHKIILRLGFICPGLMTLPRIKVPLIRPSAPTSSVQ